MGAVTCKEDRDGDVCVSQQALVGGKDLYASAFIRIYESVFAFLIATVHSRSISKSIPSIRQPRAYNSL